MALQKLRSALASNDQDCIGAMMRIRFLAVVVAVATLAACSGDGASEERQSQAGTTTTVEVRKTISGVYTIYGSSDVIEILDSGPCRGTGGYGDIDEGTEVTVTDEAGTVIGNGRLGEGRYLEDACAFRFTIPRVPMAKFYKIQISKEQRGELSYSYEELEAANWTVELELGK